MKTIHTVADLSDYGIKALTGEACAYGMRVLFDLSARGRNIVADFLGLDTHGGFRPNWNSRVGDEEAVASVMLTRSVIPDLTKFILYQIEGSQIVAEHAGGFTGLSPDDSYYERYARLPSDHATIRVHRNPADLSRSLAGRNIHQATGRTT